ncbi:hypothetical protein OSTOST_12105, partial [Ostertagia ostertagi]
ETSTKYEPLPNAIKTDPDRDEINVSAEVLRSLSDKRAKTKNAASSDVETDDMPTSELFPVKKALRYNKNSGKYDDISY